MDRLLPVCGGRYVWNWTLSTQAVARKGTGKKLPADIVSKALTELRKDPKRPWLARAPRATLQQVLRNNEETWMRYFTWSPSTGARRSECQGSYNVVAVTSGLQARGQQGWRILVVQNATNLSCGCEGGCGCATGWYVSDGCCGIHFSTAIVIC